jgi:hypothetical protein
MGVSLRVEEAALPPASCDKSLLLLCLAQSREEGNDVG